MPPTPLRRSSRSTSTRSTRSTTPKPGVGISLRSSARPWLRPDPTRPGGYARHMSKPEPAISLRPWAPGDLDLLRRLLGDPAMTEYLGGPETPEQIAGRHERYLELGDGEMLVVLDGPDSEPVGSIGFW